MRTGVQKCVCLWSIWTVVILVRTTSSEIFTSSLKVERMMMEEEAVLQELKRYIDYQYERLKMFSIFYTDRLSDVLLRSGPEVKENLKHPNAVYLAIKRFVSDYKNVLGEDYEMFRQTVQNSSGQFMADNKDILGARVSLLRLQSVYNMKTEDMINGDYLGFKGPPLGPQDAFDIGQTAFKEGKLNLSLQWLNSSLNMFTITNELDLELYSYSLRPSIGTIKALMGRSGNIHEAEGLYDESKRLDPTSGDVLEFGKELKIQPRVMTPPPVDYFHNLSQLCSLENRIYSANPNNPKMVCRYRAALIPYYLFKEEIISIAPFASVIYDFVSNNESEHLKSFVQIKLERGKIGGSISFISDTRTSDLAWIWDDESDIAQALSKKIELVTQLDTSQRLPVGPLSAEAFQVMNYGLGGHYEVHMDPVDIAPEMIQLKDSGERIATFLIYLSDVQRGGSTVFTRVGVSVAPKKNMALFWYNFDTSLHPDYFTYHAGCPVLIGEKWICNKMIWTYGNTFRRRCGLRPDATQLDIEEDMRRGYK